MDVRAPAQPLDVNAVPRQAHTGARTRVLVVGHVTTDVIVIPHHAITEGDDNEARIRIVPGGQAANTAAWLAWQGRPVTLVTSVGDDADGRARIAELTGAGVDCAARRCRDAATGSVVVISHANERTMLSQRGANVRLSGRDIEEALAARPDTAHLHLSAYVLLDEPSRPAALRALAAAREHRLGTSVDAASAELLHQVGTARCREWMHGVDLLIANAGEARMLAGRSGDGAAARELTATARNVVVKRGVEGALWAGRGASVIEVPARPVEAIDSTGAGDAFAAGLLAGLSAGAGPRAALEQAVTLGATAVSVVGARPHLPRAPFPAPQ
ncbi:carbohydrate kinase family protein [Streptomyces sp. NPDC059788]|uniref:carbohydrate kinase family protein n=1 Tax=Streptomyces sp. NPDC059788 TaxID=3346948 RepID=UPI00366123DE